MAGERYLTRDHERIRSWAEERGGRPAAVLHAGDGKGPRGLRIDFPDCSGEGSTEIGWEEWFDRFDESGLVLLLQETTSEGGPSHFHELVRAETAEASPDAAWVSEEGRPRGRRPAAPLRRDTRRTRRSPSRRGA